MNVDLQKNKEKLASNTYYPLVLKIIVYNCIYAIYNLPPGRSTRTSRTATGKVSPILQAGIGYIQYSKVNAKSKEHQILHGAQIPGKQYIV